MRKLINLFPFYCICFLAVLLAGQNPCAYSWDWYRQVQIRNKEGNHLRFDRYANGPLRAWLILPKEVEGAFRNKMPIYKIDDNSVRRISKEMGTQIKEGVWILWEIDAGAGLPGPLLNEFMEGQHVIFQYYLGGSLLREASFDLDGCGKVVTELLRTIE